MMIKATSVDMHEIDWGMFRLSWPNLTIYLLLKLLKINVFKKFNHFINFAQKYNFYRLKGTMPQGQILKYGIHPEFTRS